MSVRESVTPVVIPDREEAIHKQIGERRTDALRQLAALEGTLRHLDDLAAMLKECGVSYSVNLGPIGDAAAAARRVEAAGRTQKFALPGKASAAA